MEGRIVTMKSDEAAPDVRRQLSDENFSAVVRQNLAAGLAMRTPQDMQDSLEEILRQHAPDADLHVFGYGSLMWNPALEHDAQFRARVHGWHRRFCLRNLVGRGTPEFPGLMLALDRGGSCNGLLLRIPAAKVRQELHLLWRREMSWGSYDARWVAAWVDGAPVRALTFVVHRGHARYVKGLSLQESAGFINGGRGSLGSCRAYFDATLQKMRELGIRDAGMERLQAAVGNTA
ncbi:MAG: ChaC family protein [Ramlibacter sp.]|nr:ChaC family protein [Ramlibacter sp.]